MQGELKFAALSDRGLVRENNEDSYKIKAEPSVYPAIFLVADGLGGHQNGELASQIAVDFMTGKLAEQLGEIDQAERIEYLLADNLQKANVRVYLRSLESEDNYGMGTTLTGMVFYPDRFYLGHIGDTRCYLLRSGVLQRLSKDHTLVEQMIEAGSISEDERELNPARHVLTQALGAPEYLKPWLLHMDRKKNDRYLLCTDGLHGLVEDDLIEMTMRQARDPEQACQRLMDLALAAGGSDNITVLVIFNN
ncbi:MAG: Stp1/IreP family PP2C-type Ser/Thr phosphatase [Eubacteriales bacterium]|nr:Stp1/IreP family PP2C-type Ser/Thr phosphatase [Eubacteriales bacterium]